MRNHILQALERISLHFELMSRQNEEKKNIHILYIFQYISTYRKKQFLCHKYSVLLPSFQTLHHRVFLALNFKAHGVSPAYLVSDTLERTQTSPPSSSTYSLLLHRQRAWEVITYQPIRFTENKQALFCTKHFQYYIKQTKREQTKDIHCLETIVLTEIFPQDLMNIYSSLNISFTSKSSLVKCSETTGHCHLGWDVISPRRLRAITEARLHSFCGCYIKAYVWMGRVQKLCQHRQ